MLAEADGPVTAVPADPSCGPRACLPLLRLTGRVDAAFIVQGVSCGADGTPPQVNLTLKSREGLQAGRSRLWCRPTTTFQGASGCLSE